ncbi:MAG TPA: DUF4437 domain-containing protein [Usitatibacteraceae bacterium]|nr:DUF4437 domain-containing protein [Usitatibacteraceae bacterium]
MKLREAVVIALSSTVLAGMPVAQAKDAAPAGKAVLMPAGDIKWTDVKEFPGVKMAVLHGDPAKGAHHSMLRLPAGFNAPVHHHTADHYVTVVSGTVVFTIDGKDTKLPAGSWFAFTGKKAHITKCEAGADCVLSNDARAKWDVIAHDAKAPPAKK